MDLNALLFPIMSLVSKRNSAFTQKITYVITYTPKGCFLSE